MPFNATLNLARQGKAVTLEKDNHVCVISVQDCRIAGAGVSNKFRVVIKKGKFFVG